MRDASGYLVVAFGPRLSGFYMIDIHTLEPLYSTREYQGREVKSLTEDLARQLGQYHELGGRSSAKT